MSEGTQQIIENAPKSLKGKYDGRGKWKRTPQNTRAHSKPGPKPHFIQNLSRNSASKVLAAFDLIASLSDIYELALSQNKLELCVQMRENALNRAYGRPYQASDPNQSKKPNVLEDKRLQVAIQQLNVVQAKPMKTLRKQKQLAQSTDTQTVVGEQAGEDQTQG